MEAVLSVDLDNGLGKACSLGKALSLGNFAFSGNLDFLFPVAFLPISERDLDRQAGGMSTKMAAISHVPAQGCASAGI